MVPGMRTADAAHVDRQLEDRQNMDLQTLRTHHRRKTQTTTLKHTLTKPRGPAHHTNKQPSTLKRRAPTKPPETTPPQKKTACIV